MIAETKKAKVGVVGGTGLIGAGIMQRLSPDYTVLSLGRRSTAHRFVDLEKKIDPSILADLSVLVHAAGIRDEDIEKPNFIGTSAIFDTTAKLFRQAIQAGVRKIVYVSSAHVYGSLEGAIDEKTAADPENEYGKLHLSIELMLRDLAERENIHTLILRPNAVYGMSFEPAYFSRTHLIPFLFPQIAITEKTIHLKSPETIRNFVSSCDIGLYVKAWLDTRNHPVYKIQNTVGESTMAIREFAQSCANACKKIFGYEVAITEEKAQALVYSYNSIYEPPDGLDSIGDFLEHYLLYLESNRNL